MPDAYRNLEDITYRTVRCLREADLIAAEDTRHTKQLLLAYDIDTPLTSYHEHNKAEKGPQLIEKLKDGLMVALVSDAGMPAICDPGSDMVRLALEADIPIVPLPGANAGLTGSLPPVWIRRALPLSASAEDPETPSAVLESVKAYEGTLIFYEAPHRIQQVLGEMLEVLGDRWAVLCRELTKRYEQYLRGSLSQLRADLAEQGTRGEFVILVEGAAPAAESAASGDVDYASLVRELMEQGVDKKEAIRTVARRCGVPKRSVYQAALSL